MLFPFDLRDFFEFFLTYPIQTQLQILQFFYTHFFNEIESSDFSKVNIILEYQKISFCEKILNEEKIPLENIVCLHVRDSGYKKDTNKKSYRNSNIKNYIELIKYLTNKNYYVLRMGDSTANFFDFSLGHHFENKEYWVGVTPPSTILLL